MSVLASPVRLPPSRGVLAEIALYPSSAVTGEGFFHVIASDRTRDLSDANGSSVHMVVKV